MKGKTKVSTKAIASPDRTRCDVCEKPFFDNELLKGPSGRVYCHRCLQGAAVEEIVQIIQAVTKAAASRATDRIGNRELRAIDKEAKRLMMPSQQKWRAGKSADYLQGYGDAVISIGNSLGCDTKALINDFKMGHPKVN